MKILVIAAKWLFILCLPIVLLTASISWAVNSLWLYTYGYEKYDVSQRTGLAELELERIARGLIGYFNSAEEYVTLTVVENGGPFGLFAEREYITLTAMKDGEPFELFTEREIIHLWEVKILFQLVYYFLGGTLAFVIIYSLVMLLRRRGSSWRILAGEVLKGSILTLGLVGALALGAVVAFGPLFWWFHEIAFIFFKGRYWILDPARDYLIMLFPQGFWYDAAIFCALATAGLAIILSGVAGAYLLFSRNKAKS